MSAVLSPAAYIVTDLSATVGVEGLTYAYVGVNPSTADAKVDDATVRRWISFTRTFGGRRFIVGNVFAFRATNVNVNALRSEQQPVGPENVAHLRAIAEDADVLVRTGLQFAVRLSQRCSLVRVSNISGCFGSPEAVRPKTISGCPASLTVPGPRQVGAQWRWQLAACAPARVKIQAIRRQDQRRDGSRTV